MEGSTSTGRDDNVTFTIEDMEHRTREALVHGEFMGAEVALECVDDVLARMEVVERPEAMRRLREVLASELEDAVVRLGDT